MDSHLLPKALTRAEGLGPGLVQYGNGRVGKRSSSWYDQKLVIGAGEKVLASIDDSAIKLLRKYRLVWSGWGPMQRITGPGTGDGISVGIRQIHFDDRSESNDLRLFFLSLLWRAAVTERPEFSEILLSTEDVEKLRTMILGRETEPVSFYPITLTQISTIGLRHNHAPIAQSKFIPSLGGGDGRNEPIFRFYVDGLVIHFSRLPPEENELHKLNSHWVGGGSNLTLVEVPYEMSAQCQNLQIVVAEAELGRPLWELERGAFDD